MSSLTKARAVAATLTAAGIRTTTNPRSVVTPCVLLVPPLRTYDVMCGYTATWQAFVLGGGTGAEDSWQQLDELTDQLAELIDVETVTPTAWKADPSDPQAVPAYLVTFTSTESTERESIET